MASPPTRPWAVIPVGPVSHLAIDSEFSPDRAFTGTENLNKWFQPGDQAYIIVASAMVMVMIPGLGFLYSGLARRKSALSMIWACMASFSVITFQWYFWGYSLAFSPTAGNGFIGNLRNFGLMKTLADPSPGSPLIPNILYAFYQVGFQQQLGHCHI